jgi:hypothetical protein
MRKIVKWGLYAVSCSSIIFLTWDMPIGSYIAIQLGVLGMYVSGAINE